MRRARGNGLRHRNRGAEAPVHVAPARDLDGRPAGPGHAGRRQQRRPELLLRSHPAEIDRLRRLHVDRDAVEGDRVVQHPLVPSGVEVGGGVVERVVDVDHGPAAQHPGRIDERARGERPGVGGHAVASHPGDQGGAVDRAGRCADDQIEAPGEAVALERARSSLPRPPLACRRPRSRVRRGEDRRAGPAPSRSAPAREADPRPDGRNRERGKGRWPCRRRADQCRRRPDAYGSREGYRRADMGGMKWWGWGDEGVSFTHHDKPALGPFLERHIAVDPAGATSRPVSFQQLDIPEPSLPPDLRDALERAVGSGAGFHRRPRSPRSRTRQEPARPRSQSQRRPRPASRRGRPSRR